jgi:hypothetical protein
VKFVSRPVIVDAWLVRYLMDLARTGSLPPVVKAAYDSGHIEFEADHITVVLDDIAVALPEDHWLLRTIEGTWDSATTEEFTAKFVPSTDLSAHNAVDPYAHGPEPL